MCDAPSGSDSTSTLWGEMNVKSNLPRVENLWRPILEFQNMEQERNNVCPSFPPSKDLESEKKKKQLCYDPVGQHMIQLRQSCYELDALLLKAQMKIEKKCSSPKNKVKNKKTKLPPFSIPKFPVNNLSKHCPFAASCKSSSKIITRRSFLKENQVKEQITQFVKQVLAETGYYMRDSQSDSFPIRCLSDITDKFLTGFISLLKFHKKSFSESDNLWCPLETTLYEIEFGGIQGLYKFSSERLLRHKALLKECEDMLEKYKTLRKGH